MCSRPQNPTDHLTKEKHSQSMSLKLQTNTKNNCQLKSMSLKPQNLKTKETYKSRLIHKLTTPKPYKRRTLKICEDPASSVFRAGPQPRSCKVSVPSVPCRTSTANVRKNVTSMSEDLSERMLDRVSIDMSEDMSERMNVRRNVKKNVRRYVRRMSERMSEDLSERMSD